MSITSSFGLLCVLMLFHSGCTELCGLRFQSGCTERMDYKISVRTGNVKGAGTDATIFIFMHGSKGSTGRLILPDKNGRRFERGSIDLFTGTAEFIGPLKSITIGHNNAGWRPGWFLMDVNIELYVAHRSYKFLFNWNNWIAESELDGTIVKTISVAS